MTGRTVTVVLGGGRGTRLMPLTSVRAKPAVPLAGKYRLIDIPISNALNSGLRQIFVLTQFNSASLNAHLAKTYRFDPFSQGYVEVLAAEQTDKSPQWYQGTADAVRQQLRRIVETGVENVLILSGDHLYRMDYRELLRRHEESSADITVSAIAVKREDLEGFGVVGCNADGMLEGFREKPKRDEDVSRLVTPPVLREVWGMGDRHYLASMGVYVFRAETLKEVLADPAFNDFGGDILPMAIRRYGVAAYLFKGYWADIGTIAAFYEANLALCDANPTFRLFEEEAPLFTRPRFLPPTWIREAQISRSILAEGCMIEGARVEHSIVGLRSRLNAGCEVVDSIVMGADLYESPEQRAELEARGGVPLGIGEGASIRRAILDKNARIGSGAVIHGTPDRADEDHGTWFVRDGIIIVEKDAVIPPGAVL